MAGVARDLARRLQGIATEVRVAVAILLVGSVSLGVAHLLTTHTATLRDTGNGQSRAAKGPVPMVVPRTGNRDALPSYGYLSGPGTSAKTTAPSSGLTQVAGLSLDRGSLGAPVSHGTLSPPANNASPVPTDFGNPAALPVMLTPPSSGGGTAAAPTSGPVPVAVGPVPTTAPATTTTQMTVPPPSYSQPPAPTTTTLAPTTFLYGDPTSTGTSGTTSTSTSSPTTTTPPSTTTTVGLAAPAALAGGCGGIPKGPDFTGKTITPTLLSKYVVNGVVILHAANFSKAIFTSANLGAFLVGADLSCSNFTTAKLGGMDLQQVNFSYSNVQGADFSNANLSYTNFQHTTNFATAKFTGATTTGWLT